LAPVSLARETPFLAGNWRWNGRQSKLPRQAEHLVLSRPFNRRIAQTLDANPAWQPNTRDDSKPCHHAATRCAQHMHRLVVLDRGRIVEQGSHDALFRQGGHYAALWRHQSGGFIDVAAEQAAE
jgi:hypothetical protein